MDKTAPTYTLTAGGSTLTSGSYTNQQVVYTATDDHTITICIKKPGASSYVYSSNNPYTVEATEANNGWWYLYAKDNMDNEATEVSFYMDTVAPVGTVTNSSGATIANGGYTNKAVKYTATDEGGVSYYQVKTPGASSWSSYTAGTALSSSYGWYTFRAVDKAGNISEEYKVYYDAGLPSGTVYAGSTAVTSGSYTNASYVQYTATDNYSGVANCYVKKPGSTAYVSYTAGTALTTEGTYYFYAIDKAGNQSNIVSITLDQTKPVGYLYGGTTIKANGAATNADYVKYTASDALSGVSAIYVKKPGSTSFASYTSGTQLTDEGTYSFYCVDKAGNTSATVSITLDKTVPTGTLYAGSSTASSGSYSNASYVKYTASDSLSGVDEVYVKAPGESDYEEYTSGSQLTAEGTYYFYCTDRAGNSSAVVSITLDKTSPVGILYAGTSTISSGSYTNASYVKFTASDNIGIASLYVKKPSASTYTAYTSGTQLTAEGTYSFYAVDKAGNQSATLTVTLDNTKPSGTIYGGSTAVSSGGATNAEYVKFIATDATSGVAACYVQMPNSSTFAAYTSGSPLTTEGTYSFYAVDNAGNRSNTYTVTLDRTAPTGTLYAGTSAVSSGTYSNATYVKYVASDSGSGIATIYVKKPGASTYTAYTSGTQLTTEGTYSFYCTDKAGNKSTMVSITLDKTAPSGVIYGGSTAVTSGGYSNASYVKYVASDAVSGVANCYVKVPGATSYSPYTSGTQLTAEGSYSFYAIDRAGNTSAVVTVTLDNTAPTGVLYAGTSAASSGDYTNASYIKYTANDNIGLAGCYVKAPGESTYAAYTSGTQLTTEGEYSFYSVDKAGNKSEVVTITLDKTAPMGTLYAGTSSASSGDYTNASYVKYVAADTGSGIAACYVRAPGASTYAAYTSDTQLTAEGEYSFYSVDKAGNRSSICTIIVTRQIPAAQLWADGQAIDSGCYTNATKISFQSEVNCFVKLPGSNTFSAYISGTEYDQPGKYVFYGTDPAGNSTGEYIIIIDRTAKEVAISNVADGTTDGDVVITWQNSDSDSIASIRSVTVNGALISNNTTIHTINGGSYTVQVFDEAGNQWRFTFTSTKKNILTDTLVKEFFETYDNSNNVFAFASYEKALAFATSRESKNVQTAQWNNSTWDAGIAMDTLDAVNAKNGTYYIYYKSGNADELVAYFTAERLNAVIAEYAKASIDGFYYWEKEPATAAPGEDLLYSTVIAREVSFGANVNIVIDGVPFSGGLYNTEGRHTVVISDAYNNSRTYSIVIVRTVPELSYSVSTGSSVKAGFDRAYYFKDSICISITDALDEMAMFNIYNEKGKLLGSYSLGDSCTISESGTYTAQAVNHMGQSENFRFVISLSTPKIGIDADEDAKRLIITVSKSEDDVSHIQTLEIYKSTDGGTTWTLLSADDYGTTVRTDTLVYQFCTTAMYKVVVTDEFRTGIDAVTNQVDYVQPFPAGTLSGVTNGGYTNEAVTFTWEDEATVTVTKDGEVISYRSGSRLTEDGEYVIVFENQDGQKVTYAFVIDTLPVTLTVEGGSKDEPVNTPVTVSFDEDDVTALLYKDGEEVGAYTSGTPISEEGSYIIRITDKAQNVSEASFVIDTSVDYSINVHDQGFANTVTICANENMTASVVKDGEQMAYSFGSELTAPGLYTVTLTDSIGNTAELQFTIVCPLYSQFEEKISIPGLETIRINEAEYTLVNGILSITDSGTYEIEITANGVVNSFTIHVDATAPSVTISGVENGGSTKGSVVLTEPSIDATMQVYRDGEQINYEPGSALSKAGSYRVVLTDEAGNTTEYSFDILWTMPATTVILVVVGVLAAGGIGAWFYLSNKRKKAYYSK